MFQRLLITTIATLLLVGPLQAEEPPTVEQVNEKPANHIGKKFTFDNLQLQGKPFVGKVRFRFTLKTPQGTMFDHDAQGNQVLTFLTPDKAPSIKRFIQSLNAEQSYPVRLTCNITKAKGAHVNANVRRVDLIRFDSSGEFDGEILTDISAEDINKDPAKFVGKRMVLDDLKLAGLSKELPARIAFQVVSQAGTAFDTKLGPQQSILFTVPKTDTAAKAYLESGMKEDLTRPLRVTVELQQMKNGTFRADVKRLDVIGYDLDRGIVGIGVTKPGGSTQITKTIPESETPYPESINLSNGIKLRFDKTVTNADADKLGNNLKLWDMKGRKIEVFLSKANNTFEIRFTIKKGYEGDQDFVNSMKAYSADLSKTVFEGTVVDIHLCDDNLKTLRVVTGRQGDGSQ